MEKLYIGEFENGKQKVHRQYIYAYFCKGIDVLKGAHVHVLNFYSETQPINNVKRIHFI